uniref:Putative helicase D10 n=1 Tax=Pyramimonas orientalis virus TaxID=455367 RepID=A0A7M3UNX6_POV01|nr:putative helicase D10 [Pyramimonas orientalis virus]
MLTSKGYSVYKNKIDVDKVVADLTVKPSGDFIQNAEDTTFCVCLETKSKLFVPKYYGLQTFGLPEVDTICVPKTVSLEFKGKLMDAQHAPVGEYLKCANDPLKMGGILQLPPGAGKTVMALYILCQLGVKTMIIVHKDFLLNQWRERIEQYVPLARIGMIKQKQVDTDCDIAIASLQSLSMRDYDKDVFSTFGLVIIDECHHIAAQTFSKALLKINFRYALGLSATVNRKDGLSKVFKWFIGDIVYKVTKKKDVECNVDIAVFDDKDTTYCKEHYMFNGKVNMAKMVNNVTMFEPRTDFIVARMCEVLEREPTRNVIILSDRRKHLEDMREKIGDMYSTGLYLGGMKNSDLEVSKEKQVILGTFNMVSEGFDLPKLDTLILATSKSDIEQSVGRIQRKHVYTEEDNTPLIIDVVDDFSIFGNQHKKRVKFYKKMNYNILNK